MTEHNSGMLLRPTTTDDLDFILALEHRPDNREFIGQWLRDEHVETMARADRQHLVMVAEGGEPLGYLIAYNVIGEGYGLYIKRIAVAERSRGVGRAALSQFAERAWTTDARLISLAVRTHNERAQRCYRATGFETWRLDPPALEVFLQRVDPNAGGCLIMRKLRV